MYLFMQQRPETNVQHSIKESESCVILNQKNIQIFVVVTFPTKISLALAP